MGRSVEGIKSLRFQAVLAFLCALCARCSNDRWVVVVGSSRFWANYRHTANSLAVCDLARRMGVDADHLIAMVAEPCACSPRNPYRGQIYFDGRLEYNVAAGGGAEQSRYSREGATPDALKDILTGKRPGLESGPNSNVVLYLTGHGGEDFLKFHDSDEISAFEIAQALKEMHAKKRYRNLLLIVDTCQAASLFRYLDNDAAILGIASSLIGQNAYATPPDPDVGIALADRFTYHFIQFFEYYLIDCLSSSYSSSCQNYNSLGAITDFLRMAPTRSTLQIHNASWRHHDNLPWQSMPLTDFFGKGPLSSSSWSAASLSYFDSDDLLAVFGSHVN